MAPAAPASPTPTIDRVPPTMLPMQSPPLVVSDSFARDAIISWFRGEFAAANAIIDALCGHLAQLAACGGGDGGASEYDSVFTAIHRRRLNWIPVLQMQKYHSIADVTVELRKVAERKAEPKEIGEEERNIEDQDEKIEEKGMESNGNIGGDEGAEEYDSPDSEITDSGNYRASSVFSFLFFLLAFCFVIIFCFLMFRLLATREFTHES